MAKVLRHQAVLIRAERMCLHMPLAVCSISSRLSPGRVFQHSCRNSHGRNEGRFPGVVGPHQEGVGPKSHREPLEGLEAPQVELLDAHGFRPTAVFRDGNPSGWPTWVGASESEVAHLCRLSSRCQQNSRRQPNRMWPNGTAIVRIALLNWENGQHPRTIGTAHEQSSPPPNRSESRSMMKSRSKSN